MNWQEILNTVYWNNSILKYLTALGIFIAAVIVVKIFIHVVVKKLHALAQKTANSIDDFIAELLKRIGVPLLYLGSLYLGISILNIDPALKRYIDIVGVAMLVICSARFLTLLISHSLKVYWVKRGKDFELERSLNGILKVSQFVVWSIAVIFFLDNIGFKISTVIAGLGIGGIAIGLAAQAILKDLFSYFSIIFDRPFEVGDFIIIGDYLGSVEYIGAKTTRIRSLSGEQLIFSNADLTDSRVRNYKRMEKRRVLFRLGVTYQTTSKQLKEIPNIIKACVNRVSDTIFDRAHFFSYGDFSLVFEVVYYVMSSDYNKYMDIQQEINFLIKEEFEKQGIDFAYPTQTLYLNKES